MPAAPPACLPTPVSDKLLCQTGGRAGATQAQTSISPSPRANMGSMRSKLKYVVERLSEKGLCL